MKITAAPANATGSLGLKPASMAASGRVAATATTLPMAIPISTSFNPPLITAHSTRSDEAPNAIWIAISAVREVTT
jgi:hypothetical protein